MTNADITKAVENAVERFVPPVVERVVNGKIKTVQETLERHMDDARVYREQTKKWQDDMQPVYEFLSTLNSFNKFLKWGGITFFAFFSIIYFFIKR